MGSGWRKWVVFGSMSALGPKERKDRESLLREPYRCRTVIRQVGFPAGSDCKESACNVRDLGSMPGLGRFPGEGNGYPLQYSGLENSRDREAWRVTVLGATKSLDTTERLTLSLAGVRHYSRNA